MARRTLPIRISTKRESKLPLTLGLLLLCTISQRSASAQTKPPKQECVPTHDGAILKQREHELRTAGEKLLSAFRAGDMETFLGLVHPSYFRMGESKNYALLQLRRSFRAKGEVYCFLFDASCIAPPSAKDTPETSFSEAAKRPTAKVQSVQIWIGEQVKEPGCRGTVSFSWADPVDPDQVSTFTFLYVGQKWRTVGFDLPPTATPERGAR